MTSPRAATTRGGKRWYDWRGERYWSVTTIIDGGIPKQRILTAWAAKMVAEFAADNLAAIVPLVEAGDRESAIDLLKRSPYRKTQKAADVGTLVHEAVEAYVLGKPFPAWTDEVRPRMEAFERFLADWSPEYVMTEASVFNRTQRYAGTLDAIVTMGGRDLLLDVKSGKGVYPEVGLQLAAYRYAEFVGVADGSETPMPLVAGAAVLHLPDSGGYDLIDVRADREVFQAFLYAREVFRFAEQISKTVLRGGLVPLESLPLEAQQAALDLAAAVDR